MAVVCIVVFEVYFALLVYIIYNSLRFVVFGLRQLFICDPIRIVLLFLYYQLRPFQI